MPFNFPLWKRDRELRVRTGLSKQALNKLAVLSHLFSFVRLQILLLTESMLLKLLLLLLLYFSVSTAIAHPISLPSIST